MELSHFVYTKDRSSIDRNFGLLEIIDLSRWQNTEKEIVQIIRCNKVNCHTKPRPSGTRNLDQLAKQVKNNWYKNPRQTLTKTKQEAVKETI